MTAAMNPDVVAQHGFWFALAPIAVGMVIIAMLYARLTGRRYPFRQFNDPGRANMVDRIPSRRLGLSEKASTGTLERYSQSFSLGVEDLARLIGAAELQVAAQAPSPLVAQDIMSRNLVTVGPTTSLGKVAELFRQHRFTSLPVVGQGGAYLGVVFQMHLIARARTDALRLDRGYSAALRRLLDPDRKTAETAETIMSVTGPGAAPKTPIGALLPLLADGDTDAVPVIEGNRITGIVTRTDLISAIARSVARAGTDG